MNQHNVYKKGVLDAWHRVAAKGLAGEEAASLSVRVPGENAMAVLLVPVARKARVSEKFVEPVPLEAKSLANACARVDSLTGNQYMLHAAVYAARPDCGAVLVNAQPWGSALAKIDRTMPGIFDEQARQLGRQVERLPAGSGILGPSAKKILESGSNAFLYGEVVVCLGMTRERVVFNAELLEKCAKAFILAHATGRRVRLIPWLVRFIANRRLLKDERRSAEAYARGEIPTGFTAY